jgi:glutamyl-Q tRNA(Asp) synthetase
MGSLVCALASWLDAKANRGQWLIRVEDIDQDRCRDHFSHLILDQLSRCGLNSDKEVVFQTRRQHLYDAMIKKLDQSLLLYHCGCSRTQILNAFKKKQEVINPTPPDTTLPRLIYPGTCRQAHTTSASSELDLVSKSKQKDFKKLSLRVKTSNEVLTWFDRRLGRGEQNIGLEVGDFIVKRADGPYSYQLCVVADDIDQCVTHVVRGEDLADNTPRQILLYQYLSTPQPSYLHVPLVKNKDGEKLSKQTLAPALELGSMNSILLTMKTAASYLGLKSFDDNGTSLQTHLDDWTHQWSRIYPLNAEKPGL